MLHGILPENWLLCGYDALSLIEHSARAQDNHRSHGYLAITSELCTQLLTHTLANQKYKYIIIVEYNWDVNLI